MLQTLWDKAWNDSFKAVVYRDSLSPERPFKASVYDRDGGFTVEFDWFKDLETAKQYALTWLGGPQDNPFELKNNRLKDRLKGGQQ